VEQLARNTELAKIAFPDRKVTLDIALMDFDMCGKWKVCSNSCFAGVVSDDVLYRCCLNYYRPGMKKVKIKYCCFQRV
jgi:hypothetical protein